MTKLPRRLAWLGLTLMLVSCGKPDPATLLDNAREARAQGDYQGASVDLKNVLKEEPENAEARLLLGKTALAMGDPATAENQLRRARELGADPARVQVPLARALRGIGEPETLLADIDPSVADSSTDQAALYAARGIALLRLGRSDEAKTAFGNALRADDESLAALVGRARLALAAGDEASAGQWLDKAAEIAPQHPQVRFQQARLALRRDDTDAAIEAYRDAIDGSHKQILPIERFRARLQLAEVLLREGRLDAAGKIIARLRERAENHPAVNFLAANLAYQEEHYDRAASRAQAVLARAPNDLRSKALLGAIKLEQGQYAQAEGHLGEVLAAHPENFQVRLMLARALRETGQDERVRQLLQAGIQRSGDDAKALTALGNAAASTGALDGIVSTLATSSGQGAQQLRVSLGEALLQGGRSDKAMSVLNETRGEGEAGELRRHRLIIMAALRSGHNERAIEEVQALLEAMPEDASVRNLAGGVYMAVERYADARAQFRRARALNPKDAAAELNLGLVALADGKPKKAVEALRRGLDKSPGNTRAMIAMARAWQARGDSGRAVEWLEKARAASSDAVRPRLLLARYYLGQGQSGKARRIAGEAVTAAPDRADVLGLRGIAELNDGALGAALKTLQKARSMAPDATGIGIALARAQLRADQPDAAVTTLKKVRDQRPDFLAAGYLLGMAHYQNGDSEAALATASELRDTDQGEALGSMLEGALRTRMDELKAAAEAYSRAAEAGSRPAVLRAVAAGEKAGLDEPARPLQRWVSGHQDDRQARLRLADWYVSHGQYEQAIRHYQAMVAGGAEASPAVLNNLAWAYQQTGDERAVETARKAQSLAPDAPAVLDTLGWIETLNGNAERGVELLAKAVKAAPDAAPLRYHYAEALARAGRKDAALKQVERALEAKDFAERSAAQGLRERLRGR